MRILAVSGSLRESSFNTSLLRAAVEAAPDAVELELWEGLGDLPLYDEDLEGEAVPAAWTRFRDRVKAADAVLFVTPEYNRSVPGLLKNAVDVGSRPYGHSVWNGKPAAVMSTSMGALGGFGANHHLRQTLVFFDMPVLQQPEAYVGNSHALFDSDGHLADERTEAFFKTFVDAFAGLVERTVPQRALAA